MYLVHMKSIRGLEAVFPLRIFGSSQNDKKWIYLTRLKVTRWRRPHCRLAVGGLCCYFLVNNLKTLFLIYNSHIAVRQIDNPQIAS